MDVNPNRAIGLAEACQYVILDQRQPLNPAQKAIQAEFFSFWENFWNGVLRSVGIEETIDPDEFYRQHKISALTYDGEFIAMHSLSCYERGNFANEPYFQKFDPKFRQAIEAAPINRLLTLQYLAFNPEWKQIKAKPLIYFPMILTSLSVRHQKLEDAQAVVSVARQDLGVSNALLKMGFYSLLEDGLHNNTPVSYQIAYEPRSYPIPEVLALTDRYWERRIELGGFAETPLQLESA